MNVHFGLTAGEAFASSSDTFTTPGLFQTSNGVSTNANVPFYGVYAALTGKWAGCDLPVAPQPV